METVNNAMTALGNVRELLRSNGIAPLSLANWQLLLQGWKYFTLVAPIQLAIDWYPMGKTSAKSIFNVPGKPAWIMMELVSPLTLLYTIYTNPSRTGPLPKAHVWLTTLYCMHYFHRALLSPLRNPSIAPFNILLFFAGVAFNLANGSAIGAWLGGYGSATEVPVWRLVIGSAMFMLGLWGNVYHEEVLRDLRRDTPKKSKKSSKEAQKTPIEERVHELEGRHYKIPHGGLFEYCWYPHYFSEWFEWTGYMIAGGGPFNFLPAALFVINELATMLPRALQGKRWYLKKFGEDVPKRKAVIPGVL
ncbi:3-oxo-5-alpha-steroid 4-dehydrogenase-domain-containing protein [Sphaerosporella brunnea]|uniref:3-oxo-5-alpha-steroid 4-dehydrogenase-domain-containing protein n=1 Tax=Sphaerosporella brunnea TaxID=1250544 RepID=A0A5J5EU89_9PEZI|nr:3-oxo-5-alpha-steroid 4-dehydrogenase-domain-containing protein [Sphaerosporella brunnea]